MFGLLQNSKDALYRTWNYSLRARVAAEQGRFAEATQLLKDGMRADLSVGDAAHRADKLIDLAFISLKRGDIAECLSKSREALALDSSPQRLLEVGTLLGRVADESELHVKNQITAELRSMLSRIPSSDLKPIAQIVDHRLRGEELLALGRSTEALDELRLSSQLEAPVNDREYLARALLARWRVRPATADALSDRNMALSEFGRFVSRPGEIWQWPLDYFPGYLSDRVFSYIKLSYFLHKEDDNTRARLLRYVQSHTGADYGLADVEEARQLLAQTKSVTVH
jgi:tetratricopeptide (TPR) repeat protein